MRPIDADELIAKLGIAHDCSVCKKDEGPYCRWKPNVVDVCEAINDAPTIEPERKTGKWIPVSERLPEEHNDVLVTVYFMGLERKHSPGWNDHIKPSYYVDLASHIDGEWYSASDEYKIALKRNKVIAWMPLPESYKGDKDGE